MSGRKTKQTDPKELPSPSAGQDVPKDEPKPIPVLECPAELGPIAREEWDRLVRELTECGRLTSFDRAALAAYCVAYALWLEAADALQKYGTMMKSPSGFPMQSPYVSIATRQAEMMLRIACEFGMTPASRSRISTPFSSDLMLLDLNDITIVK
jgi:P27 family predicted phage terminase small subunit